MDLLNPDETSGTIPANFRIVDVYVNIAPDDMWTAGGIRATTENSAELNYFDTDLNTPGIEPGLFNGGVANKFHTMLSIPRGRDVSSRFAFGRAAAAGAYDPVGTTPVTAPNELNIAYFAVKSDFPPRSVDGYIARVSVDISGVPEIPGYPISDYANWGAGPTVPLGAVVVLRSEPQNASFGTAVSTWDFPQFNGLNWAMYYIPEPATLTLLTIGGLAVLRRR